MALLGAGVVLPVVIGGILGLIWAFADVPAGFGIIVAIFAGLPLLALPWGWWVLKSRSRVSIGAQTVAYSRATPLGRRSWEAPLTDFAGFDYRRELPSQNSSDRRAYHVLELAHPDDHKTVRLMQTRNEEMVRLVQSTLSDLTGLPARDGASD